MKVFNAIQIVVILMLSPTLLSMAYDAEFSGAEVVFWVGLIGSIALACYTAFLVRIGMDAD